MVSKLAQSVYIAQPGGGLCSVQMRSGSVQRSTRAFCKLDQRRQSDLEKIKEESKEVSNKRSNEDSKEQRIKKNRRQKALKRTGKKIRRKEGDHG